MSRALTKTRKTKMTDDTKTPVDNTVNKDPSKDTPLSISPAGGPVDNTGKALVASPKAPPALTRNEALEAEQKSKPAPAKWSFDPKANTTQGKGVVIPQHEVPEAVDPLLVTMLCWPRRHDSPEELAFTAWLKNHITTALKQFIVEQEEGSFSVSIPYMKTEGSKVFPVASTTLFSCHVDTVDSKLMDPASRKKLTYDPSFGTIALDSQSVGSCLGADDSAGIWLMLKMIEAGTPGTYLFHRGEECGGISAGANASKRGPWLKTFNVAVAFDRKDTGDIVTVQGGARCASPKFASRLGGMLDEFGFRYQESTTGSYTDVKDYRHLIPEVVNLSCGYDSAHTRQENLDYAHLAALAAALPKVQWESLPIDRDPAKVEPQVQAWKGSRGFGKNWKADLFDDEDEQWGRANAPKKKNGAKKPLVPVGNLAKNDYDEGFSSMSYEEIENAVVDDPSWVAENIVRMMRHNAKLQADVDILETLIGL